MNQSMINASVTMNGLMRKLDVIARNMSNMSTDGFKKQEATFEDLLTTAKRQSDKQMLPGRLTQSGLTIGSGARLSQVHLNMAQGTLRLTDNPYDLAIEGDALFEVGLRTVDANGDTVFEPAWTRNGAFRTSIIPNDEANSMLTTTEGGPVYNTNGEPVLIPSGRQFTIDTAGNVYVAPPEDSNGLPELVATLKLVRAVRPQLLQTHGDNIFVLPDQFSTPEARAQLMQQLDMSTYEEGTAPIHVRQGFLEGSNVEMPEEMSELIQVQRAFQLSARALSSSDTMMDLANKLRG